MKITILEAPLLEMQNMTGPREQPVLRLCATLWSIHRRLLFDERKLSRPRNLELIAPEKALRELEMVT